MSLPESHDVYWMRVAREQRDAMKQQIANGEIPASFRLNDYFNQKRVEEAKAREEQRAREQAPANNTFEAWRSHPIASGLNLPPNDPRVLEEKQRIINGVR